MTYSQTQSEIKVWASPPRFLGFAFYSTALTGDCTRCSATSVDHNLAIGLSVMRHIGSVDFLLSFDFCPPNPPTLGRTGFQSPPAIGEPVRSTALLFETLRERASFGGGLSK
ncbi:MAG TPA: hypothetical protein V6D11_03725 [Waterburya sp.]